jgi:peptidoglycan/LPS O-acetylase OafA/YrhL
MLGAIGLFTLGVSLWLIRDTTPFPGPWTLLPVGGTLLVLLAGTTDSNWTSQILSTKPMVKIRDWSYSIYLWHWPFIVFAGLLWPRNAWAIFVATSLSIVPALISYRYLEQPLRGMQNVSIPKTSLIVGTTIAVPIIASAAEA